MPDSACHSQWAEYLNPNTDTLSSSTSASGTRHVLRLAFNSELVAAAVRAHIERYTALLLPPRTSEEYTPAELAALAPWQRSWVLAASRARTLHMEARLDVYAIRYETTLVSGWSPDPDHPLHPSEAGVYGQLYGDTTRFYAFLATYAPHCTACKPELRSDSPRIQFVHEARYRHELYRLVGRTSPPHGITRPLRLDFKQLRRAQVQCCSVCGETDHTAHACGLRAARPDPATDDGKMEVDEARPLLPPLLGAQAVVCRDCYDPGHRETCHTPHELMICKVCNEPGHTSFRCPQYRTSWVPLTAPPSSHAPNPRPLALIAQQCGRPRPSWSDVASTADGPRTTPSPHPAAPALADPHAFPALPGSRTPADPAAYTDTAPPSPSSPSPPPSPTSPPSAELAELKAIVAMQQRSLQALQALHQQSVQRLQASLEANTQRVRATL